MTNSVTFNTFLCQSLACLCIVALCLFCLTVGFRLVCYKKGKGKSIGANKQTTPSGLVSTDLWTKHVLQNSNTIFRGPSQKLCFSEPLLFPCFFGLLVFGSFFTLTHAIVFHLNIRYCHNPSLDVIESAFWSTLLWCGFFFIRNKK